MKAFYSMVVSLYVCTVFLSGSLEAQIVNHIVISEVYGGGGNSGATWRNDYVELYNPSNSSVNLTGWSLQYASATGQYHQEHFSLPRDRTSYTIHWRVAGKNAAAFTAANLVT